MGIRKVKKENLDPRRRQLGPIARWTLILEIVTIEGVVVDIQVNNDQSI